MLRRESIELLRPRHTVALWASPFCWVSSHFPLLPFPGSTSASWSSSGPTQVLSCALSQPPAVCYFVYMWWWLCWSPFFFVYVILCICEIPMCLNELCFIYSDCCTVRCRFIDHLLIDCSQLCCHRWDVWKPSFLRVFFHVIIYLFLAVLCRPLLLCGLFLRGCPLASHVVERRP